MNIERLPVQFIDNMREMLGSDVERYLEHMATATPRRGLRVNGLKVDTKTFESIFPYPLIASEFSPCGYYLPNSESYGTHPYHHAGLFYMQEPSAMSVVTAISPYIGERVLDLCSAPGGKGTYLASLMDGKGTLVLNEYVRNRANILRSNVERMGIRNATITNNSPADFARLMPSYFDTIVVDAPCSGEGMFLKEESAIPNWSPKNVEMCAVRQLEILDSAYECLAGDGYMVYSTCTLNKIENEGVIEKFLHRHSDMEVVRVSDDLREHTDDGYGIVEARRIFPHRMRGEGHFLCLMHKADGERSNIEFSTPYTYVKVNREFNDMYHSFANCDIFGRLAEYGDNGYLLPSIVPYNKGINIVRSGVQVYTKERNRLTPAHSLVLALDKDEISNKVNFSADSQEIADYLRGNVIRANTSFRGYGVITVDDYPLGIIKSVDGTLKNHYPKGLRNLH